MIDTADDDMLTKTAVIRLRVLSKSSNWRKQLEGSFLHYSKLSEQPIGWLRSKVLA